MDPRPKGLTETAVVMSVTNAMGWLIVDWSKPHAATTFVLFTIFILVGYLVIWFYWQGRNWARGSTYVPALPIQFAIHFPRRIHGAVNDWGGSGARRVFIVVAQ
jgi:hypothetical protein